MVSETCQCQRGQAQGQIHGEQAEAPWAPSGLAGRIIGIRQAPRRPAGHHITAAEGQPPQQSLVPAVQPVDGEAGAARQAVPPASHGVRCLYGVLQAPAQQTGEQGRAPAHLVQAPPGLTQQAPLGPVRLLQPAAQPGHKGEGQGEQQSQRRGNPSKEIGDLIRREHRLPAGKPEHHRPQQAGSRQAIEGTFQRQRPPAGQPGQHRLPLADQKEVSPRRQQGHRPQQAQQPSHGPPPPE